MKNSLFKISLVLLFILTTLVYKPRPFNYTLVTPIITDYSEPDIPTLPGDNSELYGYLITDSILL